MLSRAKTGISIIASAAVVAGSLLVIQAGIFASAVNPPTGINVASTSETSPAPEDVIRQFYSWFVKANYPEPKTHKTTFRRYVTDAGMRKAIKATDYVYFTQAQDEDPSWGTNIAVTITSNNGTRAVARVKLGKTDFINDLTVELIKTGGVWKINNVKRNV